MLSDALGCSELFARFGEISPRVLPGCRKTKQADADSKSPKAPLDPSSKLLGLRVRASGVHVCGRCAAVRRHTPDTEQATRAPLRR